MNKIRPLSSPEIQKFRTSELLTQGLKTLLSDPTLQQALQAIRVAATPATLPEPMPGVHYDTVIAHHFHTQMGVHRTLATLEMMCFSKGKSDFEQEDSQSQPFASSLPADLATPPVKPTTL